MVQQPAGSAFRGPNGYAVDKITMRLRVVAAALLAALLCGCSPSGDGAAPEAAPRAEPPRIIQFYAYPSTIELGREAQLCYGVAGVDKVAIEPGFPSAPPFQNRCLTVAPRRDTEYVLTATGPRGEQLVRKVLVAVKAPRPAPLREAPPAQPPPGPSIASFTVSPPEVVRGGQVTFCYETSGAESVRIEPPILNFRLPARGCFGYVPGAAATYTLIASDGKTEARKQVAVAIR